MKATGVVRRIDELGRLVIPKEIRKTFKIKEGDSIEFFVENNKIVLEKYSLMNGLNDTIANYCITFKDITGNTTIFVSEDKVECASNNFDEFKDEVISKNVSQLINNRTNQIFKDLVICIRNMKTYNGYLCPLLVNSEIIGGFLILSDNHLINDQEKEVIHSLIKLLVRELEV